jgi:hypothetical protein
MAYEPFDIFIWRRPLQVIGLLKTVKYCKADVLWRSEVRPLGVAGKQNLHHSRMEVGVSIARERGLIHASNHQSTPSAKLYSAYGPRRVELKLALKMAKGRVPGAAPPRFTGVGSMAAARSHIKPH